MTATDELRKLLDERGVKWTRSCYSGMRYLENTKWPIVSSNPIKFTEYSDGQTKLIINNATPEQAIAATLGSDTKGCENLLWELVGALDVVDATDASKKPIIAEYARRIAAPLGRHRAKSHPYGYERDTGAYDCTRCECGCINDISAMYCNDCGGEIEIDESAEKEIYEYTKGRVFAVKHDDGSLEFCERRYVPENAATLVRGECQATMHLVELEGADGTVRKYRTSHYDTECGRELFWPGKLPPYCPYCRRLVKGGEE